MLEEPRERAAHVVTMNAQFVEIAHQQEHFAALLRRADLSVADGSPWCGRRVGWVSLFPSVLRERT